MANHPRSHHHHYWRHLVAGGVLALLGLLLLAQWGPDPDRLRRWFFHTGVEGELRVMPEIHVIQDEDEVTQTERRAMAGATRGLDVEVVQEHRPEKSVEEAVPAPAHRGVPDPDLPLLREPRRGAEDGNEAVEQVRMVRPTQQSMDFVLTRLVRPRYPAGVPEALRRRTITVDVAIYVAADGKVDDAYVTRGEGGPAFEEAALSAVLQWEYRYLGPDGKAEPFWDQVRWIFAPTAAQVAAPPSPPD